MGVRTIAVCDGCEKREELAQDGHQPLYGWASVTFDLEHEPSRMDFRGAMRAVAESTRMSTDEAIEKLVGTYEESERNDSRHELGTFCPDCAGRIELRVGDRLVKLTPRRGLFAVRRAGVIG